MTHLDVSSSAFCLIIEGLSMAPDYMPGDRVIIDPRVMPSPGDCVAAINNKNEGTFKRYKEKGTDANGTTIFELVPINQDYPTMRSDVERIEILGTMVEHRKYRRRQARRRLTLPHKSPPCAGFFVAHGCRLAKNKYKMYCKAKYKVYY